MSEERMKVLNLLAEGKITADDAAKLLDALNRTEPSPAREIRSHLEPMLGKVASHLDAIPEQVVNEHLPRLSKGVGRVVEALSGALNQGLGLIETYLQPTYASQATVTFSDLEGVATLDVQNTHGRILVIGEPERTEVEVRIHAGIAAENAEAAKALFNENPSTVVREGGQLKIAPPSTLAQTRGLGIIHRHRFDFEVRVPAHLTPYCSSLSGEIRLEGLAYAGRGRLKSFAGNLCGQSLTGDLEANTVSGDVTLLNCSGLFDFKTVSGDIEAQGAELAGKFTTVSGDLSLDGRLKGETRLKTISGDVDLRVAAQAALSASSTSGDLSIDLTDGSAGYVDASTRSGELESTLNLNESLSGKRHLKGRLGEGSQALSFSSVSGDIRLQSHL